MRRASRRRATPGRSGGPKSPAQPGHRGKGVGEKERAAWYQREGLDGQVGPGGRGGRPPAIGQLQDEPWDILPPEVVGHGCEQAADLLTATLKDTDADPANVE